MLSALPPFEPTPGARAVWQARRSLGRTVCAVVRDPFAICIEKDMFAPVPEGTTLRDLAPIEPGAWLCQVDDELIGREHWHHMPPQGALVVFRLLPQGGGKGSLRILLQIAAVYFLGPAGLGLQGFTLAAATIGVSLALNALIPLDRSNAANNGGSQQYNAQAQGNIARIGQPVPEVFGYDYGWPDLATPPYAEYAANEQFLYVLLCIGRGMYRLDQISVGDTPIGNFSDATVVRIGPGQTTLAGPGTGVLTLAGQSLVKANVVTSSDVSQVEMKTNVAVGPFAACGPEQTVTRVGVDIVLPRGLDGGRSIAWKVEVQKIDDFSAALGGWTLLALHSYSTASVVPLRLGYNYFVASGRYQVRLTRTDTRSTDNGSAHDISWLALRGELAGTNTAAGDDCTYVAIKIRASGQLSGSLRFRVMSNRMLPTWTGSAWTAETATRNPAWALARVLKSRGVPDTQIDLVQLLALATTWAARQDNFDYRFDSVSTTWDALALIARVGRAMPLIRGAKYTFARDAQESAPVAAYGMRNIKRGSFALALALPTTDPMTTLDLEYWDHRRWDWVVVTAQIYNKVVYGYRGDVNRPVGVPAPDALSRGRIKMPGIIGQSHAMRTAVYTVADGFYRRMIASYSTELDGLLPAPLALTVLQHDVGNFGQGGDVANWVSGTLTISTTEPLQWEPLATHYVRLAKPTGELTPAIAVTQGATEHDMVLASAPSFTPPFDDAGRERTRYYFGPAANMGALCKVRAIVPRSEREIEHRVVLEDDRVHSADNAWLPTGAVQDAPSTGATVGGGTGGTSIVSLTDRTFAASGLTGGYAMASFALRSDGVLRGERYEDGGTTVTDIGGEWIVPQTVSTAISGLYEVMATDVTNGSLLSGPALGVWLPLSTTRVWALTLTATDVTYAALSIQIREIATGTVQSTHTLGLNVSFGSFGP